MINFTPTTQQIAAATNVFMSMAWLETIKPVVLAYRRLALTELGYGHIDPERIAFDLPEELLPAYFSRCKELRKKSGLAVKKEENCPLCEADWRLTKAHWALFDAMEPATGVSRDQVLCAGLDKYEKYIDLSLRLLAPFVDTAENEGETDATA